MILYKLTFGIFQQTWQGRKFKLHTVCFLVNEEIKSDKQLQLVGQVADFKFGPKSLRQTKSLRVFETDLVKWQSLMKAVLEGN